MRIYLVGAGLILLATAVAFATEILVIRPAFTPLPNGMYGEMFGPVSHLRGPFYGICVGVAAIGAGVILWRVWSAQDALVTRTSSPMPTRDKR